jgi:hypothetical protein
MSTINKDELEQILEEHKLVGTMSMYEPGDPRRADWDALVERARKPEWKGSEEWHMCRDHAWQLLTDRIAREIFKKANELKQRPEIKYLPEYLKTREQLAIPGDIETDERTKVILMTGRGYFADLSETVWPDLRTMVAKYFAKWGTETETKRLEQLMAERRAS